MIADRRALVPFFFRNASPHQPIHTGRRKKVGCLAASHHCFRFPLVGEAGDIQCTSDAARGAFFVASHMQRGRIQERETIRL
jgi:hypothetical protein